MNDKRKLYNHLDITKFSKSTILKCANHNSFNWYFELLACAASQANTCNGPNESLIDIVIDIIGVNYLTINDEIPIFRMDFGYALYSLKHPFDDYLCWWHNSDEMKHYLHYKKYQGFHFYDFLQQEHQINWKTIVKRCQIKSISSNAHCILKKNK